MEGDGIRVWRKNPAGIRVVLIGSGLNPSAILSKHDVATESLGEKRFSKQSEQRFSKQIIRVRIGYECGFPRPG